MAGSPRVIPIAPEPSGRLVLIENDEAGGVSLAEDCCCRVMKAKGEW